MNYIELIIGRYVHVTLNDVTYRIGYEEAGTGAPLVCLHTAGGDLRQYRHILNDEAITNKFRTIAFDMPRHGRSLPPDGTYRQPWEFNMEFLMDFVDAFCDALDLREVIVLGTSMGGYIALSLAVHRPGQYRALIAVQPRAYAENWGSLNSLLDNPRVNIHSFSTIIKALVSPESPIDRSDEIEWVYNQAGPGVLAADFSAAPTADVREPMKNTDPEAVGLYVIGGDWDLSCLPAHTDELVNAMPNLPVVRVPGLGHFGTAENPELFRETLLTILAEIERKQPVTSGDRRVHTSEPTGGRR
jgi:pimeloyl-ACP methyl ester carboxylesterase